MANNRMYLVRGDKKVLLAKYYPGSGWYVYDSERLTVWLYENSDYTLFGNTDFKLDFEIDEEG